jgi:hypothetical protein
VKKLVDKTFSGSYLIIISLNHMRFVISIMLLLILHEAYTSEFFRTKVYENERYKWMS